MSFQFPIPNFTGTFQSEARCFSLQYLYIALRYPQLFTVPLNVLSFSRDFSMDQVLDKYYDKQNAFDILIQNGADPSLKDNDGSSLIHSAAEGGNTSIIIKLLSPGLDVDSRNNDGVTPLMTAAIGDKQNDI